jgi:hypothetical protein
MLLLWIAPCLPAQSVRYGVVVDSARSQAMSDWKIPANEHAYCITRWAKRALSDEPRDTMYAVFRMQPAPTMKAGPEGIVVLCPKGQPTLHTHPGDSILTDCNPSRQDLSAATASGSEFEVLQCGRDQFVFFYPSHAASMAPAFTGAHRLSPESATALYIGASSAILLSNAFLGWDQDRGGYPDVLYPNKQALHFAAAAGLTQVAIGIGVRPVPAVIITSLAGVGFEFTQGHVNGHDIAADILGSITGALIAHWLQGDNR